MVADKIYVAIMTTEDYYISTSWEDVITLFNKKYPNNGLVIEKYFVDTSPTQTINAINDFIKKYPSGKRAIVSNYSSITIVSSDYCKDLDIINVSPGANSNKIKTLNNTLTYAPYNQYSVMSFFQIFVDYQMCEVKVLYEPNTSSDTFYKSILDEIIKQADLLGIKYSVSFLKAGQTNYNIKKKSGIFILSDPEQLKNIYVTPKFLKNIPPRCFFALSESYYQNIFGDIPALVFFPFPINFTVISQEVYDAIVDKRIIYYTIFSLYDILFVLNDFSTNGLPLNKNNYINVIPYNGSTVPAALYNSYLEPSINGAPYGKYQVLFTKNVIIGEDQKLFFKNYRGGQLSLPDSYSIFKNIGLTPNNDSLIEYDEAYYYKIYDKKCKLMIVRFNSNITNFSLEDNLNVGTVIDTKFIYAYTQDGYFSTLERLFPCNMKIPQVNQRMSKVPIKLKYVA